MSPAIVRIGSLLHLTPTRDEPIGVLDRLPVRPLLAGEDGLRLSLAGAQAKVPVALVYGAVALPTASVGLDVAAVEVRDLPRRAFLPVARYDRILLADGSARRVHQEDFCQALGAPSETKYASAGGSTWKDCCAPVRQVSVLPAQDVPRLLDAATFNLVVGNADAHGKNVSILWGVGRAADFAVRP